MKKLEILLIVLFSLLLGVVFGRYGSANPEVARNSLFWIMGWSLCALLVFPGKKRRLTISRMSVVLITIILGYGWFMVVNARAEYVFSELSFKTISGRFWEAGPGSVTKGATVSKMIEVSGLFLAFFAAVRARESWVWKLLLAALPILGAVIMLVGLYHRVSGAPAVWFSDQNHPPTFFAPFVYNAHAGAYLNFAGAIGFSFWVSTFRRDTSSKTIGWGIVTALCFLGAIATASKGAFLILAITLGLCVLIHRKRLMVFVSMVAEQIKGRGVEGKLVALVCSVMIVVFAAVGMQKLMTRMDDLIADAQDGKAQTVEGRKGMMRVMVKMASGDEGGWVGFGPGSFEYIVPYFMVDEDYFVAGRWIHGHSDPLQLAVEWGYLGSTLWALFALGALYHGSKSLKTKRDVSARILTRGMMIGLISMALHSSFDFPFGILSLKFVAIVVCGFLWGGGGRTRREEPEYE